jgi:hypothetical protein
MDTDAIKLLPQLVFDGLYAVPCESVGFTWSHSLPARAYPYVNGDGHDWTGRRSAVMQARLYFLNTLGLEQPGIQLFPGVFNAWLTRLLDGSAGNLEHPIYGNRRARVMEGSAPITANVRSGCVVDATFTETLDSPEQQLPFNGPTVSAETAAVAAQAAATAVGISYPDGALGEVSLLEAYNSIKGQINMAATSVTGKLNQLRGAAATMIADVEALQDPTAINAVDNLLLFWDALGGAAETVLRAGEGTTRTQRLTVPTSIDEFARSVGNSTEQIMNLNPGALRFPTVPVGFTLTYYAS